MELEEDPPALRLESDAGYTWRNLTKEAFLQRNRRQLQQETAAVNAALDLIYATNVVHVTESDVWVLTYIEAGLSQGHVDPDFRHSEGERGLLPLPENVRYWNGPVAPRWNRPMPLEQNLHHFYLYLGQLMNKAVRTTARFTLYRDLFRWHAIKGDPRKQVSGRRRAWLFRERQLHGRARAVRPHLGWIFRRTGAR